MVTEE